MILVTMAAEVLNLRRAELEAAAGRRPASCRELGDSPRSSPNTAVELDYHDLGFQNYRICRTSSHGRKFGNTCRRRTSGSCSMEKYLLPLYLPFCFDLLSLNLVFSLLIGNKCHPIHRAASRRSRGAAQGGRQGRHGGL